MLNPFNNYWLADNARVFASARQLVTDENDPDYTEWTGNGNTPTPWPRDDAGDQTNDALQATVGQLGMFVDLKYYTWDKRWSTEQHGITLTSGMPIKTDDRAQAKINGLVIAATNDPTIATNFHAADDSYWPLDAAAINAMSAELQSFIDQCFATSKTTIDGIDGGTITTRAQVDAAFDGLSTRRKK